MPVFIIHNSLLVVAKFTIFAFANLLAENNAVNLRFAQNIKFEDYDYNS